MVMGKAFDMSKVFFFKLGHPLFNKNQSSKQNLTEKKKSYLHHVLEKKRERKTNTLLLNRK